MPSRDSYRYIYVAAFPDYVKIGITKNIDQRAMQLRRYQSSARVVRVWEHENPHAVELMCRDEWHLRRVHQFETFDARPCDAVRLVNRFIRAYADGARPLFGWRRRNANTKRRKQRCKLAESTIRKHWKAPDIARARAGKIKRT